MAGWVSQFKLGRPGYELSFDINPNTLDIEPQQVAAEGRVLSGHLRKWVFRTSFPVITLQSNWFTVTDFNAMQSLLTITDTMLSFKARDGDLQTTAEICYPSDVGNVPIRENSAVLLSATLVAAGSASCLAISGVYTNPGGTGTNYYTGGSYADASQVITLGTSLPTTAPCYATYTYPGWLVSMKAIKATFLGGQVDLGKISGWSLVGV